MRSDDGVMCLEVSRRVVDGLSAGSMFSSVQECSGFFEKGSLGYSHTQSDGQFDGLELRCGNWGSSRWRWSGSNPVSSQMNRDSSEALQSSRLRAAAARYPSRMAWSRNPLLPGGDREVTRLQRHMKLFFGVVLTKNLPGEDSWLCFAVCWLAG